MAENVQLDGYVSIRLLARAAGISINNMRQIAFDCAAGRRPSWLGSSLHMRTRIERGGRRQEIAVGSLPDVVRAELATDRLRFLVAAEQAIPGAELRHADFMLLHRAAQCEGIPPEIFARLVTNLQGDCGLGQASREQFDLTMDYLFGLGFRDTSLPEVAPDYLAWLEEARTQAGLDVTAFTTLLTKVGAAERPDHLTGAGFYMMVAHLHQVFGVRLRLPSRYAMSRTMVGQIHLASYRRSLAYRDHSDLVTILGGGCLRTYGLDLRGARRVLSHHYSQGFISPEPPPRVGGAQGFITQPQANLIWKLWHDHRSSQDDLSEASLAEWLRTHLDIEGGLHGLTVAGTRRVIDYMLRPLISSRCE